MLNPEFTLDVSDLAKAAAIVLQTTGRGMAESLNRAALHVIIGSGSGEGAMQATPKASKAAIRAVSDTQIRALIVSRFRAKGKLRRLAGGLLDELVKKEKKRRLRASGYTAFIGWTAAAIKLGGTGARGKGKTPVDIEKFKKSEAFHGNAKKARPNDLLAFITNTAPMAEEIGFPALQKGIDNAAKDLLQYARNKLEKAGKEAGF